MLLQVRNDLELGTMYVSSPRFSCAAAVFFFLSPSFHLTLYPPFIRPFFPSYLLFLLSTHKQPVPDVCRGYWFLRGARQCRIHASGRPDFYSCVFSFLHSFFILASQCFRSSSFSVYLCLSSNVNTVMHTKERHIRRMLHMNSGRIHMRLILRDEHFNYNIATRVYLRVARSRYRRFY